MSRWRARAVVLALGLALTGAGCSSQSVADYCAQLASCDQLEANSYADAASCVDENQTTVDCLNSSSRSAACATASEGYLACMAKTACAELGQQNSAHCETESAAFSDKCQTMPAACKFHDRSGG
jgi:hypothetical protein